MLWPEVCVGEALVMGSQPINDRSPINTGIVHFTSGKIQPSETFQGFLMYDQIIFQRLI